MNTYTNFIMMIFICALFTWNITCFRHSYISIKMSLDTTSPESLYQKLLKTLSPPIPRLTFTHTYIPTNQIVVEKQPLESSYLSTIEWKNINYILNHNESTPELRNKVKNIITPTTKQAINTKILRLV